MWWTDGPFDYRVCQTGDWGAKTIFKVFVPATDNGGISLGRQTNAEVCGTVQSSWPGSRLTNVLDDSLLYFRKAVVVVPILLTRWFFFRDWSSDCGPLSFSLLKNARPRAMHEYQAPLSGGELLDLFQSEN